MCITIAANIAETAVISYPMCFPDSVVGFTADKQKTSEIFVYYIFSSMRQMIQNSASGSTQDNINLEYLNKLEFRFPEKEEQEKIEGVLSNLDKKILNNDSICADLEGLAKLIYDYWFVQFEFPDDKNVALAKAIHEKIKDKSKYSDWSNRADIKAEMQVDIILLLAQAGYPPTPPEVYEKVYADVIAQVENFKKYSD